MNTIGGTVTIKNGIERDYCFEQCIESLVPICSEINVVDSDSTDDSQETVRMIIARHSNIQIRLLNYPWVAKPGDIDCILDKMNWGRERLGTHYHLHLEADELLGKESYEYIRAAAELPDVVLAMRRLNFWQDANHLLAPGYILSPTVIRFAPQVYWMGGDAPHPKATQTEPAARWEAINHCFIYHYGMLRRTAGYLEKYKDLMCAINGSENADPVTLRNLVDCAQNGEEWMKRYDFPMLEFSGTHPESILMWLRERNRL